MNESALFVTFLKILVATRKPARGLGKQGLPVVFQTSVDDLVEQAVEQKADLGAPRHAKGRQVVSRDAKLARGEAKPLVKDTGYQRLYLGDTGEF